MCSWFFYICSIIQSIMQDFIKYFFIVAIVLVNQYIIQQGAKKKISPNNLGKYVLRSHVLYCIMGIIGVIFGIWFGITLYFFVDEIWPLLLMMIFFFGIGGYALLKYFNHQVIFDEQEIEVRDLFRKTEKILVHEILTIEHNPFSGHYILKSDHKSVKLSAVLVGANIFKEFIEKHEISLR